MSDRRGGRVAMVATRDDVYGMFRMWGIMREDLNYEVRVFHTMAEARDWLSAAHAAADTRLTQ